MKTFYFVKFKKYHSLFWLAIMLFSLKSYAQPATVSIPVGEGRPCGGSASKDSVKYFNYNSTTNILTHRSNCKPVLASPGFSSVFSSITFNAYDGYLYFSQISKPSGVWNTYTYRWLPTTCPNGAALPVYISFPNQFVAGVEFDPATGLGYQVNFVGPGPYTMELQEVNFTTGVLGASKPINFGGRFIYAQNGDVIMTPGGQFLAVYDNKYFTVNWKDYNTATPLVATFIDTLGFGAGNNLVGLSYSGGKLVGGIQGAACSYKELDILTGAQSPVTYSGAGTLFSSSDMTNIPSGIGAAKSLISAIENPVGSQTYDVVYEVVIKNYGGTPVTSIQGYDSLTKINGAGNVISGSITSFTAPAGSGITKNAAYDGKTAGNFNLLTPGSSLSNIPGKNTITLRISCKISNLLAGIIYNNQAVITGTSLLGDALRDSSTNGSNPDLNLNDKPDDIGESQPTPLLIGIVPQTPPCTSLTNVLYTQDFGSGTGLVTTIPAAVTGAGASSPTGITFYTGTSTQPIPTETYTLGKNAQNANTADFISLADHTGNTNGRMLIVNADAANTTFYQGSFATSLCPSQQYSLSFYAAFVGNSTYQTICNAFGGFQYPKIKMRIRDGVSGLIITEVSTPSISTTSWQQFGLKFISPSSYSNIIIQLINDAPGGCGNDIAFDDIQFGTCDPLPAVNISSAAYGCIGSSAELSSSFSDPSALPGKKNYQWQVSSSVGGPFIDIVGANSNTYIINSVSAADTGKYYRVIVAALGNMGNPYCQYTSVGFKLSGKVSSVPPALLKKDKNNICPGITVKLSFTGGSLGTNAVWKWYADSCGGTSIGTGTSINVTPLVSTTYYLLAEGDCNTTSCVSILILISCDIDKDKDGIPDYVESNMPLALQDADGDGISNAFDWEYAGFKDYNNDFIDDDFQADGDSDNDGIPNYLDTTFPGRVDTNGDGVDDRFDTDKDGIINMLDLDADNDGIPDTVEAYGVDANGDGKIDNYTDTDGDGLSQNVDDNNTGARISGVGLGIPDLDGDGIPNYIDSDSDNDGIPDVIEAGGIDANNNGIIDSFIDANADGISDLVINTNALLKTGADINNDGKADSYPYRNMDNDRRANPYDCDSDGDGITDVTESGLPDTNFDGWIDGTIASNGWSTTVSAMASLNLRNSDTRGNPNYLDIDSDDDGIPDNIEGMATFSYLLPSGIDSDNDGLDNAYDNRVGFGAPGIFPFDKDGDSIPDYLDLDTDSDGIPDIVEGNDFNRNGLADDNVSLTFLDSDGDGLDNRFDSLNSVTDIKGTSYNMGTGGTTSGDIVPGGRTPVQQTSPIASDRDWRSPGTVVNVKLLKLSGVQEERKVTLTWQIQTIEEVDHFEIEQSINNLPFEKIGTLNKTVLLDKLQKFSFTNQTSNLPDGNILYRIKVVPVKSNAKFSNVFSIHLNIIKQQVTVTPNPAANYATLRFNSKKDALVQIALVDNAGNTVLIQEEQIHKGNNTIRLNNLANYSEGMYTIRMMLNGGMLLEKILLLRNK